MKIIILVVCIISLQKAYSQELFVVTEPASNMPNQSIGLRAMNSFMMEKNGKLNYHIMPEIMWGASAKLMLHFQTYFSNRSTGGLYAEGGSLYAKIRLLSTDDIHAHFRLAVYGRYSTNRADIHQDEIETMGHNTGYESGLIATGLKNKVAVSTSISIEKALDNTPQNKFPSIQSNRATNYTLSIGKLMYPKRYTSIKQTNINLMVECLGQTLAGNGKSYVDIVPAIQFIIRSQARIDFAYRKELYSNMRRTAANGFLLKLEYNLFNVRKKGK